MRNKILMTLALLLTAATGAWAQSTLNVVELVVPADWETDYSSVTAADLPGFKAVTLDEAKTWTGAPAEGNAMLFYAFDDNKINVVNYANGKEGSNGKADLTKKLVFGIKSNVKFYYTAEPAEPADEPADPAITVEWDPATKTGNFVMPAYDVEIAPIYAPVAQWATDGNLVLTPTAIEGIYAGTEEAIVNAGTVVEGQGTAMYFATTDAEMTAEKAAKAEGWLATLPTAAGYDGAQTVYVWYYIKGADAPDGQTATAENTFNDLEICATPLKVEVLSNKFDIQYNAANANTIESGKATVKVGDAAVEVKEGKLTGVKMDSKVTITAKDGYKFRKAEGKKTVNMLYIEASNHKLYYMEGETWRQAINNHTDLNQGWQYGGMEVWFGNIVNVLKGNGAAVDPGSVIDPTKTYTL